MRPAGERAWRRHGSRTAVTWNSGVGATITGCVAVGTIGSRPAAAVAHLRSWRPAAANTDAQNIRWRMLWTEPRWVSCAPFGNPVAPWNVQKIVASSSGSIVASGSVAGCSWAARRRPPRRVGGELSIGAHAYHVHCWARISPSAR